MNLLNPYRFAAAGPPVPSYANPGGSGDRSGLITISQSTSGIVGGAGILINGNTAGNEGYFAWAHGAGYWIKFDFGSAKVIDELKWYQSHLYEHGVWNLQGSNDDSSWTDTNNFTLGSLSTTTSTHAITGFSGFRYARLIIKSGNASQGPYIIEAEFQIDDA